MNIATEYKKPLAVVAQKISYERIEARLTLYNLETGRSCREFPVRFDSGGERLALSSNTRSCFVGCYYVYGLASYSIETGVELWRRKDLKAVQEVTSFPSDDWVFCGREGVGHLLCTKTGKTLEKTSGVKAVYTSPFSKYAMLSARSLEIHSSFGTVVGRIKRTTFAVLDCAFSSDEVLISEAVGNVRCFTSNTAELLWTHVPPEKGHYLNLCFCKPLNCFVGIYYGNGKRVVRFDRYTGEVLYTGNILCEAFGGMPHHHQFCFEGTAIFTSDLQLLSVETGKVIRTFQVVAENKKLTNV